MRINGAILELVRLVKRQDFVRITKQGKKAVASALVLQVAMTPEEERKEADFVLRLGFTVSAKVGNAVVRNRIRRRLKAVAAEVIPAYASPGHDYVIIGRYAALKRPYEGLIKDLKYTLHNTGSFHAESLPSSG